MEVKTILTILKLISIFIWACTIASIVVFAFMLGATKEAWLPNVVESQVSCSGIENFYTNTTFQENAQTVVKFLNNRYEKNSNILTPSDILNGKRGDCDTISHTIMCLSKLYNVTCRYYSISKYNPTINSSSIFDKYEGSHVGIYCNVNGRWIKEY